MIYPTFGAQSSSSGLGAFGLNLKSFVFQLITFLLVILVLRRFVLPTLISTLDKRRQTLEESLVQAKKTEEALKRAEITAEELIKKARDDADDSIAAAGRKAQEVIAAAEQKGSEKAARIITEAEQHLDIEREKLRSELRGELADLVAQATEKVLRQKIDAAADAVLIKSAVDEVKI